MATHFWNSASVKGAGSVVGNVAGTVAGAGAGAGGSGVSGAVMYCV